MEQNYKIIQDAITESGISSPPVKNILNIINLREGNTDKETINEILKRYFQYILAHRIENVSRDEKYIAKADKMVNLYDFIFKLMHRRSFPIPKTKLTEALFGDRDFFEMVASFEKHKQIIEDKRAKFWPQYQKLFQKEKEK